MSSLEQTKSEVSLDRAIELSLISCTSEEKLNIVKDVGTVLDFVKSIQNISIQPGLKNTVGLPVLRDDVVHIQEGQYSKDFLISAPDVKESYLQVKKIITK
ncbi:MAG: hypothetical protein QM526_00890 [Alphaproteobacteria bacterium]|nr:hypothetical protein [Alphaproteobacteria bacterium]